MSETNRQILSVCVLILLVLSLGYTVWFFWQLVRYVFGKKKREKRIYPLLLLSGAAYFVLGFLLLHLPDFFW